MIQFLPIIGTIIDKVLNVIDKSVEDKDLKEKTANSFYKRIRCDNEAITDSKK